MPALPMGNSNADPSHTSVKMGDYRKVVEKALPFLIALVISGVSLYRFSVAILIYFFLEELRKRTLQLEILSEKVEKLAVQQQEIGVLGTKVAMLLQMLERPRAEEAREQEVLNCEPVVPDQIEDEARQPIEHTAHPLTDTEAGSPSALSCPVALEQKPENGSPQQTGTSDLKNRKPDCAEPPSCCNSPHLKPKAPQMDPALLPQQFTSHPDARLARPCDPIYSSFTRDQRFQAILKIPYQLDLRNEPAREDLKHIVIDGSNVAMAHGLNKFFSCRGIAIAVEYFWKLGNRNITVFVPQWRTSRHPDATEQHFLSQLRELGIVAFTPCRKNLGQRIASHDDRFLLHLADKTGGIIVTNDNLREFVTESVSWREIITRRLLQYTFVGDIFMVPDDPLGRDGPRLEAFLQREAFLPNMPPHLDAQPNVRTFGHAIQSHVTQGAQASQGAPPRMRILQRKWP